MTKIRVTEKVPDDLAIVANVGKEYEITAQWGEAVEIEGEAAVRVRLLPDEYEWVAQCKCPEECGCDHH